MDKPDQQDIRQRSVALENACGVLITNLREIGGDSVSIPTAPTSVSGADLQYYTALGNYHAQLAAMLAGKNPRPPSAPATTPARASATEAAPAPVASATASAPAALTADETAQLSWTEKVQLAGKKISVEKLRARIAERAKAKESSNAKAPSALSQVLKARGVESVQALAALPARNLD